MALYLQRLVLDTRISTCFIVLYPLELQTQQEENQQEQNQQEQNQDGEMYKDITDDIPVQGKKTVEPNLTDDNLIEGQRTTEINT